METHSPTKVVLKRKISKGSYKWAPFPSSQNSHLQIDWEPHSQWKEYLYNAQCQDLNGIWAVTHINAIYICVTTFVNMEQVNKLLEADS